MEGFYVTSLGGFYLEGLIFRILRDWYFVGGGGGGQKSVVYQNFTPSPQNKWYEKYHMKIVPSLAITIFQMDPSPSPSPNPF